ncbi:MAG: cupin domain-containing protein [Ilumatobacteraceae bacterium]
MTRRGQAPSGRPGQDDLGVDARRCLTLCSLRTWGCDGGGDHRTVADGGAPEGGHYAETWRGPDGADGRATATLIYFLLQAGERSHWHRADAAETWCWHAGAPLRLRIDDWEVALGPDLLAGERPHAVVPPHAWQAAESNGDWTLVSCVVAPGFEFEGFELAPPGWSYGQPNPGSG